MSNTGRIHIEIRGIVQGVGFRPFVYRLANKHRLTGWVGNSSRGVEIEVEGPSAVRGDFLAALEYESPPLAKIEAIRIETVPVCKDTEFVIHESTQEKTSEVTSVSPDVAICGDCFQELFDPEDRRYLYPFINCTHCGPRFTITKSVPYDRPRTTMAGFPLCRDCMAEYDDPDNRRFHAQPVACPVCGPHVALHTSGGDVVDVGIDGMSQCRRLLSDGRVVAIKGLGGYHLACDAHNVAACETLRSRKVREDKPFAVMVRDVATARRLADISPASGELLTSRISPIVIVPKSRRYDLAPSVAPATHNVGVMLPYTPLHHLLFDTAPYDALVMTSGNRSEEPICYVDDEVFVRLGDIADGFLTHNRPIHIRCDDSVVKQATHGLLVLRRARGYAPEAIILAEAVRTPILACGGELKHTFCIGIHKRAYVSHHIGDLNNEATWRAFTEGIDHYCRLFEIQPEYVAHDMHPDYLSTHYAESLAVPRVAVQHHHAHIASCIVDNELSYDQPVIGLAFDGTGYGDDGTIWGGEWLHANVSEYERVAHVQPLALPGGEQAIRQPWRLAAYVLDHLYDDAWETWGLPIDRWYDPLAWRMLRTAVERGVNCPETSAMGRLFDAVAAVAGVRGTINYEAQGPIEFEQAADRNAQGAYTCTHSSEGRILDWRPAIQEIVQDLRKGAPAGVVSMRFHRGLAESIARLTAEIASATGTGTVVLSGGVFQNELFTRLLVDELTRHELVAYVHQRVPPNDGGLSLGQLAVAGCREDNAT